MESSKFFNLTEALKHHNNASEDAPERPTWYYGLRLCLTSLGVFGNGFLIILILTRRQLRRPSQNWLILSLGFADFFVGAFNTPAQFICFTSLDCTFKQWEIIGACSSVFLNASITNLTLLMLDRYVAVVHPFHYQRFSEKNITLVLIFLAWWGALVLGVIYATIASVLASKQGYYISFFILLAVLPNEFMLYAFIRVLIVVRRHRGQITRQERQVSSNRSSSQLEERPGRRTRHRPSRPPGLAAVGAIVIIFLISNGFYQYWLFCKVINEPPSVDVSLAMVIMRYFNSTPNFIIYVFLRKDIRHELKAMFSK